MTQPTALRERIASLFRHPPGTERLGDATPGEIADAALAVLGDHRAAVLREAADDLKTACPDHGSGSTCFMRCQCDAANELRRMAEEARS